MSSMLDDHPTTTIRIKGLASPESPLHVRAIEPWLPCDIRQVDQHHVFEGRLVMWEVGAATASPKIPPGLQ
jgi:hypothetical protein